jgi:hypothetical protein
LLRPALPEKPATTPLPVQLGASDGTAVSVPPLTMPTRGPRCTLGDHRVFNRSCWGLETGLPWPCWPVPTDPHGTAALPDTTVSNVCARGSADGSRAEAVLARVGQRSDPTPLDLRGRPGDGTHTVAKQGGNGLGSAGDTPPQGEKGLASLDNHGEVVAPLPGAPVHKAETMWWPEGVKGLTRVATRTGVGRAGASRHLEGGVESTSPRQAIVKAGRLPHITEPPRHRRSPTRGRTRGFNEARPA